MSTAVTPRDKIFNDIDTERAYQDSIWGTTFDKKNTVNDWAAYANLYIGRATKMGTPNADQRVGILKAVTLLIAALERFDENDGFSPRHYDTAETSANPEN